MGYVYVLTNPAFEGYVKIGKTTDLEQRIRSLDNTSVPLPFRCEYAVEVDNHDHIERLLHQTFSDHRTRKSREFFEVHPQRVIAAMKLTQGTDVTPKSDIAEDEEGLSAIEKTTRKSYTVSSLFDAQLSIGDILHYVNDDTITAEVCGPRKVLFEGVETSLSASALTLLHREGYTWRSANGWNYWMFDDEAISERMESIKHEQSQGSEIAPSGI